MLLLKRVLRALPLLLVSPAIMAAAALALAITDVLWKVVSVAHALLRALHQPH